MKPVPATSATSEPQHERVLLVLTTVASREQADLIAQALVDGRFAACVNVLGGCRSVYRWRGAVEQADETILLAKTTRERYAAFEQRLRELHPYDLPEIVALAPQAVLPAYARWVIDETREDGPADAGNAA